MIVHIFRADLTFHCVEMIRNIIDYSNEKHYFVLFAKSAEYREKYLQLFREKSVSNYCFCDTEAGKLKLLYRGINVFRKKKIAYSDQLLFEILDKNRNNPVVFHGNLLSGSVLTLLLLKNYKNLSWVNWGNYLTSKDRILNFNCLKKSVIDRITIGLYKRFGSVVTLLKDDEIKMKELGLRDVRLIPYINNMLDGIREEDVCCEVESDKVHVLLGNSCHSIPEYYKILDIFALHDNANRVIECMLNYGYEDKQAEVDKFISYGQEALKNHFKAWTNLVDIETYKNHFKEINIFVCGKKTQTGLGAIYLSLLLGKKIYLTGYNYNWIRNLGFIIYDLKEIDTPEHLNTPLCQEDKLKNFQLCFQLFSTPKIAARWDNWYQHLYEQRK